MRKNILITGKDGFIGSRVKGGKAFRGRLENYKDVLREAEDVSGIIHLAAKSNARLCEADPIGCFGSNVLGVYNVLMAALEKKIWVLFISSYQVREKNLYGLSKLMGEELCRIFQDKGVRVKILRLPIVYGPGDRTDKVVTKIIGELRRGIQPKISTDKKFYFIYVDDVAKIIENEVDVIEGKFGRQFSLHELVDSIRKCL
jgi:nucleoside-diphosphate-sugar epimerase